MTQNLNQNQCPTTAERCYQIAREIQTTGVQRFEPDFVASEAINEAWQLRTLLSKLRISKNFCYTLSSDSGVQGGTALATELYETLQRGCFLPRALWTDGRFDPRLELLWEGLRSHPLWLYMQPDQAAIYAPLSSVAGIEPGPRLVQALNDFLLQLSSRMASQRFKTRLANYQSTFSKRVERMGVRLEKFMLSNPGACWVSFSVWFAMPSSDGHVKSVDFMGDRRDTVARAIRFCVPGKTYVSLLRPVLQRDGWMRVDVAVASAQIFFTQREALARLIGAECERLYRPGAFSLLQLQPMQPIDTHRVYAHWLGHWEACRRLALYFGGADMAVAHCKNTDAQLFQIGESVKPSKRFVPSTQEAMAWPFGAQITV